MYTVMSCDDPSEPRDVYNSDVTTDLAKTRTLVVFGLFLISSVLGDTVVCGLFVVELLFVRLLFVLGGVMYVD